jgi:hypothetical protein
LTFACQTSKLIQQKPVPRGAGHPHIFSSSSIMRFLSCISFLFAIGAFFLPWIDVRCEGNGKSYGIRTQSGFEIATGESSEGDAREKIEQEMKDLGIPVKKEDMQPKEVRQEKYEKVPVLWGFVGCLGFGAFLCLVMPAGAAWRAGAIIAALGAGGVLAYQLSEGFPMVHQLDEEMAKEKKKQKANPIQLNLTEPKLVVVYKPGFYLACLFTALPIVFALADTMIAPKSKPRHPDDVHDSPNPFPDRP